MNIFISILGLLILFAPTALKVWRDTYGVRHPDKTFPVFICVMISAGFITWNVLHWPVVGGSFVDALLLIGKYSIVSASFYASVFPYWINWVHLKNGVTKLQRWYIVSSGGYIRDTPFEHIVSHLSRTAWPDKTWWWRAIGWKGRLIVNALILIGGLTLYFL